jgi:hypothetical protein
MKLEVCGEITGIRYKPFLCKFLEQYNIDALDRALSERANFILKVKANEIAVSWWVSPKRTRSYPYARVYDTLSFAGKKITIIPVIKDEGKDDDRDFLQWDTISLMSLLGVYVIIAYYKDAEKNPRFDNKITNQRFDTNYIKEEIQKLLSYQSDALHWNLEQIDQIYDITKKAFNSYRRISEELGIEMHSMESAQRRIRELHKGKERFMRLSRELANKAQMRESITTQPKEYLVGIKSMITIKNYLGGYYYFTCDEVEIHGNELYLIEGKHTQTGSLPSEGDIKDGLIKMILFTNLENVTVDGVRFKPLPVLKLTTGNEFRRNALSKTKLNFLELLEKEARYNRFKIKINDRFIV